MAEPVALVTLDERRQEDVLEVIKHSLALAESGEIRTVIIIEGITGGGYVVRHAGKDDLAHRLGLMTVAAHDLAKYIANDE